MLKMPKLLLCTMNAEKNLTQVVYKAYAIFKR